MTEISASEESGFLNSLRAIHPELLYPTSFVLNNAPAKMKDISYVQKIFDKQDFTIQLLNDLNNGISDTELESLTTINTNKCNVWCYFAVMLMLQKKSHQALEVLDAIYSRLLYHQNVTGKRFHKGLPLFYISQCYQSLGKVVHAKRHMMLTLCEDAISDEGILNLENSGSYGRLAWVYGLSDRQIRDYAAKAWAVFQEDSAEAAIPDWILQEFDQLWKTEVPSEHEVGSYHINKSYCNRLIGQLGGGDCKALECVAQYLVGSMPGCRAYKRRRTFSTDFDVVVTVEGAIVDFRSELGRYFVCECKDRQKDKAAFADVAKFCRVLDSVKAKFGVIFSPNGLTGEGETAHADREILKVYQDRGIVIVVVDRDDLCKVAKGANFISMLREKYETVRLDLRNPPAD